MMPLAQCRAAAGWAASHPAAGRPGRPRPGRRRHRPRPRLPRPARGPGPVPRSPPRDRPVTPPARAPRRHPAGLSPRVDHGRRPEDPGQPGPCPQDRRGHRHRRPHRQPRHQTAQGIHLPPIPGLTWAGSHGVTVTARRAPAPATAAGPAGLIPGSTGHDRRTGALPGAATGQESDPALTRIPPTGPWPGRGKKHRSHPPSQCAARTRCTVRTFRLTADLTWAIEYRSGLVASPGENPRVSRTSSEADVSRIK
jgi:hypothetical protein